MTESRERALELLKRHIASGREASADPGVTAMECMVALEGLGYRPTEAKPAADWRLRSAGAAPSASIREQLDAAKAACATSPTRVHPAGNRPGETP